MSVEWLADQKDNAAAAEEELAGPVGQRYRPMSRIRKIVSLAELTQSCQ
jgi:hypothetical protein